MVLKKTAALSLLLSACTGSQHASEPIEAQRLVTPTRLPEAFTQDFASNTTAALRLPARSVQLTMIERAQTELREGPGPQFPTLDALLSYGEKVLVFQRVGVWMEVMLLDKSLKGWVHSKALGKFEASAFEILASAKDLPVISAARGIRHVYSYPDMQMLRVAIPKGREFRFIKKSKRRHLVWIPETNSLAWVSDTDAF